MKPYFYLSKKKSNDKKRQKKENRIERFKQQQIKKNTAYPMVMAWHESPIYSYKV